jgi:hypothetical protein
MDPEQDWYKFKTLKRRSYDSQVWVPLRAHFTKERKGEFGQVGFREEYLSVGTIAVAVEQEAVVRSADSQDIRGRGGGRPYVDGDGRYVRAEEVVGFHEGVDGIRLVLDQSIPGRDHQEWHLNQDFVLGMNLLREGDVWVRVEEGRTPVAQLHRNDDGSPQRLEVKVEFLKDYLSARKMVLAVGTFSSRSVVQRENPDLPWERPTAFEEDAAAGWRWRGDITEIHEGTAYQFGSEMRVLSMKRTDYDPDDEAPALEVGGEFKSDSWTVPLGRGVAKVYRVSGELWKTEWISPAASSPRVGDEKSPSTAYFNVGGAGVRVSGDDLPNGLEWLWFRPEIVADALSFPDGNLEWFTANTGNLRFTPGNGVHFGVNELGNVNVLAVDIERLPSWDQNRWAAFNISPTGKVSDELVASQVRAEPADTVAPEAGVVQVLSKLGDAVKKRFGVDLYLSDIAPNILRLTHRFTAKDEDGLRNLAKDITRLFAELINHAGLHRVGLAKAPGGNNGGAHSIRSDVRNYHRAESGCKGALI